MRARIRSCTSGPQTILGAEDLLHQEQLEPVLAGRRVLVADDEAEVRQTICAVLEKRGCEVIVCGNGSEAIEQIDLASEKSLKIDLVISDVRMPDRNGYEVFRCTKDFSDEIPVILMTGFGYDPHHSIVRSSQLCSTTTPSLPPALTQTTTLAHTTTSASVLPELLQMSSIEDNPRKRTMEINVGGNQTSHNNNSRENKFRTKLT